MVMVGVKAQIMDPGFNIMVINFNLLPCNISWQIYADYLEEQGNFTCYAYRHGFYSIESNNSGGAWDEGCGDGEGNGAGLTGDTPMSGDGYGDGTGYSRGWGCGATEGYGDSDREGSGDGDGDGYCYGNDFQSFTL